MTYIVSIQAQYDNIGDMVIRAALVDWLSDADSTVVVVGKAPSEYIDGMRFGANVVSARTVARALWRARGERVVLCFAPGEQALDLGVRGWPKAVANLLLAALVRLCRGRVYKVGRGYRGEQRVLTTLESWLLKLCQLKYMRDARAVAIFPGSELMPDIALASRQFENEHREDRTRIAFSLRSDRAHPEDRLLDVAAMAAELDPCLVVQVRRDSPSSQSLAGSLSWRLMDWEGDLASQLDRVVDVYRSSRFVVSDRLHALLFGIACGAIPIGIETGANGKLRRQLKTIGLEDLVVDSWGSPALQQILRADVAVLDGRVSNALDGARQRLEAVRREITATDR